MGSLPRTPRLIAATIVLLGCAPLPSSAPPPSAPVVALPSAWATDPRVVVDSTARTADTLYVIGALQANDGSAATSPVIVPYAAPPGADLRELLDGGGAYRLDVLVTTDANVIAYAEGRANYFVAALPWNLTYVLVPASASAPIVGPNIDERNALARNAVTASARGSVEPFPWRTDSACAVTSSAPMTRPHAYVAYVAGDETSRQLAERVVSIAGTNAKRTWISSIVQDGPPTHYLLLAKLPAESVAVALAAGRVAAAVVPVARDPRAPCFTTGNARVNVGAVPLVDTRAHVIVRRGSGAAFTIGADGSLHFFKRAAP
jgi:hypothetical protein